MFCLGPRKKKKRRGLPLVCRLGTEYTHTQIHYTVPGGTQAATLAIQVATGDAAASHF